MIIGVHKTKLKQVIPRHYPSPLESNQFPHVLIPGAHPPPYHTSIPGALENLFIPPSHRCSSYASEELRDEVLVYHPLLPSCYEHNICEIVYRATAVREGRPKNSKDFCDFASRVEREETLWMPSTVKCITVILSMIQLKK